MENKLTQAQIIMKYLEQQRIIRGFTDGWVKSYELIKVNTSYGWLGSGADRQARRLAEEGDIERRHNGKYAEYRAWKIFTSK